MADETKISVEVGNVSEKPGPKAYVFKAKEKALLSELENTKVQATRYYRGRIQQPVIQKVPDSIRLREMSKHYYTPREISIGPIHASNSQLAKRDLKLRVAARFLSDSRISAESVLGRVKDDLDQLRKCFEDSVVLPFDDDELASILFLDACFVVQFISSAEQYGLSRFGISNGLQSSIQQDLFLLENQVPFRLLKIPIGLSGNEEELMKSITRFVGTNVMSPPVYYDHRLHINYDLLSKPQIHLLDMLRSEHLFTLDGHDPKTPENSPAVGECFYQKSISFRNIQDLNAAGISLKPSKSSTFLAVSFSKGWLYSGKLMLPAIIVNSSTVSKMWNLVAYEMCPDYYRCNFGVSAYLSLMDSLVDNAQDVRDLRADHVLLNRLSSDEDVARLFNDIGSTLLANDYAYTDVKLAIQLHYERKRSRWVNLVWQDYFSNPWKVLALFAAFIAILLTACSTWFTVCSSICSSQPPIS